MMKHIKVAKVLAKDFGSFQKKFLMHEKFRSLPESNARLDSNSNSLKMMLSGNPEMVVLGKTARFQSTG